MYILSRPAGHIVDIDIATKENTITATFNGDAVVTLLDGDEVLDRQEVRNRVTFTVPNPHFWNAEQPYLYTLKIESCGEVITQKVGLRTVSLSDRGELLINGIPVKLQGVNRHDTHPTNGWSITDEEVLAELQLMKQLNVNCIRTSHYPPAPKMLEYCDELGFYVVLEADMETHGFCTRFGNNHKSMIRWLRDRDASRLIHTECACRKADDTSHPQFFDERYFSDVFSGMYYSLEYCRNYCENEEMKQPLFLCEYAHAMGNGPGDICDYWELIEQYPNFIGGCVWEWADHTVIEDGVAKYGGDWETELLHDGNFCCDGIVFHDRSLKAGSLEMKCAYQPTFLHISDIHMAESDKNDSQKRREFAAKRKDYFSFAPEAVEFAKEYVKKQDICLLIREICWISSLPKTSVLPRILPMKQT